MECMQDIETIEEINVREDIDETEKINETEDIGAEEKIDICSLNYNELAEEIHALGEQPFRSRQIYEWLHVKLVGSFDEMTNLSKSFREKLSKTYEIPQMELAERQISKADPTEKFLFGLGDGNMIESVLMRHPYGNSVCVSSQAGCRMGCRFCASAIGGKAGSRSF